MEVAASEMGLELHEHYQSKNSSALITSAYFQPGDRVLMMRAYLEFVVKGHLEYVVRDQQVDNKRDFVLLKDEFQVLSLGISIDCSPALKSFSQLLIAVPGLSLRHWPS